MAMRLEKVRVRRNRIKQYLPKKYQRQQSRLRGSHGEHALMCVCVCTQLCEDVSGLSVVLLYETLIISYAIYRYMRTTENSNDNIRWRFVLGV